MQTKKAKRGFQLTSGQGLPYEGTWIRQTGPRQYHVIELTDMDDACGRDNKGLPKFVVELAFVDLNEIGPARQKQAWDCAGYEPDGQITVEQRDRITAECCYMYGAKAPMHSASTDNAHEGFRECRKESYSLTRDASAMEERLEASVNRIGSSALEYMRGDITSPILRGVESNDPAATIMAKAYVAANGQTLGGQMPREEIEEMKAALDSKA